MIEIIGRFGLGSRVCWSLRAKRALTKKGCGGMLWLVQSPRGVAEPMNILERGKAFVESLRALAARTVWDWKQCPACGSTLTIKNGGYTRRPWFFSGRECVRVQRHLCHSCAKSYSEQSALLVRRSYSRNRGSPAA